MSSFNWPPIAGTGGGSGVTTYANQASLPTTTSDGAAAITLDTDTLWIYNAGTTSWKHVADPTIAALVLGATNANTPSTLVERDSSGNFSAGTITASLTGNVTGNLTGSVTGHASLDVATTSVGAANGVASLDASGKVPVSQLPSVVMEYQGAWNPSTNTPSLADGTGTNGNVYYVSAAKSGTVSGLTDPSMTNFQLGDLVIYSSSLSKWQLVTPAAGVQSVNGAQGAVTVNAINQLTGDVTTGAASGSASAAATVAKIAGVAVGTPTGTGNVVFSNSPTLVSPALGTPSALVLTNATGTPSSIGLANGTGLPLTTGVTGTLPTANGGYLLTVYQTSAATAANQTRYLCNTTSAAFTMTLPTGTAGAVVMFVDDAGTWATNNLTIAPAAAQTIQGISSNGSLVCNLSGAWVELAWDATNSYWVVAASGFQYGPTYSPGVTGGILPSTGVPGATSGSAITSGYVGQVITSGANTTLAVTGSITSSSSVALTAGVWLLSAVGSVPSSGSSTSIIMAVNSTPNAFTGSTIGIDQIQFVTASSQGAGTIAGKVVNTSSSVTYYVNLQAIGAQANVSNCLTAVRIA